MPRDPARRLDSSVLLFLFALFLWISPVLVLWARDSSPWYLLYLLWLIVIALIAWVNRGAGEHDV